MNRICLFLGFYFDLGPESFGGREIDIYPVYFFLFGAAVPETAALGARANTKGVGRAQVILSR